MMTFWLAGVAMVAVALAFVIPPLVRTSSRSGPSRGQANIDIYRERIADLEAQQAAGTLDSVQSRLAREEMDRELLEQVADTDVEDGNPVGQAHPLRAIVIAVALPLCAIGIYLQIGSPRLLLIEPGQESATATPGEGARGGEPPSVAQMVERLEQRLLAQPDDIRGWMMLARSYTVLSRHEDARSAYSRALERAPNNPDVMVGYAEALATINEASLDGEPIALVNRALAIAPDNPRAMWLAGIHAMNQGIPSQALSWWQKILDGGKLDAEASEQVSKAMAAIRSALASAQGGASTANSSDTQSQAAAPAGSVDEGEARVRINVSLSPQLRTQVSGTETVFVFARANNGPPMPLAVQRLRASQLPSTVVLDDSNSMTAELAISRFDTVVVTARVSRTGTPRAAPGDLQGISAEIATRGADTVDLVIDQQVQ